MVFWSSLKKKIKESISRLEFNNLKNSVDTNTQNITNNTNNINTLNENVNTNTSDILDIKSNYAKKNSENTFTQINTFNNNLQVLNDKELKIGYRDNDIKLRVYCDTGAKHMNLENPQGDIKINTPNGNVFINTRDTLNLGTKRINNLGNPNDNQDAATKKYVDDKVAAIPSPDLSNYLTKTEANADFARIKSGITNDWYSTNTFRKTPQILSTITNSKDIATKEYVDSKIFGKYAAYTIFQKKFNIGKSYKIPFARGNKPNIDDIIIGSIWGFDDPSSTRTYYSGSKAYKLYSNGTQDYYCELSFIRNDETLEWEVWVNCSKDGATLSFEILVYWVSSNFIKE